MGILFSKPISREDLIDALKNTATMDDLIDALKNTVTKDDLKEALKPINAKINTIMDSLLAPEGDEVAKDNTVAVSSEAPKPSFVTAASCAKDKNIHCVSSTFYCGSNF
jgi:hypothetical protein